MKNAAFPGSSMIRSIWGADLIAVLDDQATYSLMACNHPKVREIPVVFSGVNYPNTELLQQYPNVTGYIDRARLPQDLPDD